MKTTATSQTFPAWAAVFALWCSAVPCAVIAAEAEPELSLSLRGVSEGGIEVGEPFRVAVRVDAPVETSKAMELAPAKGSWIDATIVEILSADGKVIPAASQPAGPTNTPGAVVLDAENPVTGLWWFPAENLSSLAPGDYRVRARLVIRDGTGWKGEAVSEPAELRVVLPSTDPDRMTQRKISHARAALFSGEPAKAGQILNDILETEPNVVSALVLRAGLSLQGGNRAAAQACIDRALVLSRRAGEEPSAEIHELAMRIENSRTELVAPGREVPAWTRVPRSVFEPVRTERSMEPGLLPQAGPDPKPPQVLVQNPRPTAAPLKLAGVAASTATVTPTANQISTKKSAGVGAVVTSSELSDPKITADPAGQWAASATAGSQYGKTQYSAAQATGAPNIMVAGNSPDAWCPAVRDKGLDWLEVTFAKPVQATELRVRQNDAAGAITKIEAFEPDGTVHVWWEGVDPYVASAVREIVWFAVRVPKTSYAVARVKLTLNLASGPGYKEIDAVQLVAAPDR